MDRSKQSTAVQEGHLSRVSKVAKASRRAPETRARKRGGSTEQSILDAARRVLEEKSILEVSVSDFVREAGVSQGTFYNYYPDKYEMLKVLAKQVGAAVEHDYVVHPEGLVSSDFKTMRASILFRFNTFQENLGVLRSLYQLGVIREDFKKFRLELRMPLTDRMMSAFEASMNRGDMHFIDARVASEVLSVIMTWTCMEWFCMGMWPHDDVSVEHFVDNIARLWYRAVFAQDPVTESDGLVQLAPEPAG